MTRVKAHLDNDDDDDVDTLLKNWSCVTSCLWWRGLVNIDFYLYYYWGGCPCGVMVKAMNCRIVVSKFVLQSRYYIHFRANTLGKGMNLLIPPLLYIDLRPGQTCHSKDGGRDLFRWPVMGRNRIGGLGWQYGTR